MEPILQYDRLSVLREEMKDYEVFIKPKDLKMLSKERREELLQQRVHLLPCKRSMVDSIDRSSYDKMILELNIDENFTRYSSVQTSSVAKSETNVKEEKAEECTNGPFVNDK